MRARTKIILSSGFFLFTIWVIFLYANYTDFQNLRHTDIFWVLNIINPYLYIILLGLVATIAASIWYGVDNRWVHVFLLSIFALILLCTPYFVCGMARFPDTFGVILSVENLPQLLSGGYTSYAANYPLSYLLFYCTYTMSGIDLLLFSRFLFSPLVILTFLILWYLFISRILNPKIAFLSTFLAIPVMLIEVSITPNAVAMVLVLAALLLLSIGSWGGQTLAILLALALVLVHPFNIVMLAVMLISFKLSEVVTGRSVHLSGINVSITLIALIAVAWLGWSLYVSPMGSSIMDSIINVFSTESKYTSQFFEYSTGAGNLSYAWIQQLTQVGYLIIGVWAAIFVLYDITNIVINKYSNHCRAKELVVESTNKKIVMILMASFLLILSFSSLLFLAGGEQIVSRSLNYAMFALSTYIAICIMASIQMPTKKILKKFGTYFFISIVLIGLILTIIYPLHGYAKESYISYSESFVVGRNFNHQYNDENSSIKLIVADNYEYHASMMSSVEYEKLKSTILVDLISNDCGKTYTNMHYSIISNLQST